MAGRHILNRQLLRRPFSAGEGSLSSSGEHEPHPDAAAGVVAGTARSIVLAPDLPNDATDGPKEVLLKRMIDSAESNLHRMLALADDLYEEEVERHNRVMEKDRNGGGGARRPNRRRTVPLRDRVENMTQRKNEERSFNGAEGKRMRLERRRRQWEAAASTSLANEIDKEVEEKGEVIEGLGRKLDRYQPPASMSMFSDESSLWMGDGERIADDQNAHAGIGSDTFEDKKDLGGTESVMDTNGGALAMPKSNAYSENENGFGGYPIQQDFSSESHAPSVAEMLDSGSKDAQRAVSSTTTTAGHTTPPVGEFQRRDGQSMAGLMDLLSDDFAYPTTPSDDSSQPVKACEEEGRSQAPSLMDLLNENFSVPLSERSDDETDFERELRPRGSLMDLLSDNFSADPPKPNQMPLASYIPDDTDESITEKAPPTNASGLLGLLDIDDEDEPMGTSFQRETHSSSLMELLDEDEQREVNEGLFESEDHLSVQAEGSEITNNGIASIADTDLNNESAINSALDTTRNSQISTAASLLDLMSDGTDQSDTLVGVLGTDDENIGIDIWRNDYASEDLANISETVDELLSLLICASKKEWGDITNTSEVSFASLVVEMEKENGFPLSEEIDTIQAEPIGFANHILSDSRDLTLTTDELNLTLLQIAMTPPTIQTMEVMVKLFKLMESNRGSGKIDASPNAATYTILMAAFGDRGNDHQAAKFVCERMLDALRKDGLELSSTAVSIGARCLKKAGDIINAEKLLSESLGELGSGVEVSPGVFHHVLALYKEDNLQADAIKLLDIFFTEVGADGSDFLKRDEFIKSLIRWPERNRRGNRIAVASHHQNIYEYLERRSLDRLGDPDDQYQPSYFVWRDLLRCLFRAAQLESGQYEIVRRACRCLVNSSRDETHPDYFVLNVGLKSAEALGDAKLASDMILWAWESAEQFVETASPSHVSYVDGVTRDPADKDLDAELDFLLGSTTVDSNSSGVVEGEGGRDLFSADDVVDVDASSTGLLSSTNDEDGIGSDWSHSEHESGPPRYFVNIPVKAYFSAIKICLARGEPELAHAVLRAGCVGPSEDADLRLPQSSRSHLFNLVMSGYSQVGASDSVKSLLDEMRENGPRPTEHTYAAFITSLAMADQVDEAIRVIDTMLCNGHGDGIVPGSSSFNSAMLAALKSKRWQQVLDLNKMMVDAGISPDSQSYFAAVLASTRLGDRASALKAAKSALGNELPINHQGLNLLLKALIPNSFGDGSIGSVRGNLRSMGQHNKDLAVAANALSRSLRMAEAEERRPKRTKDTKLCEKMWNTCLRDLCALVHKKDGV